MLREIEEKHVALHHSPPRRRRSSNSSRGRHAVVGSAKKRRGQVECADNLEAATMVGAKL